MAVLKLHRCKSRLARQPLKRHPAQTWTIKFYKHHVLVLPQLQISLADIHRHLIAQ